MFDGFFICQQVLTSIFFFFFFDNALLHSKKFAVETRRQINKPSNIFFFRFTFSTYIYIYIYTYIYIYPHWRVVIQWNSQSVGVSIYPPTHTVGWAIQFGICQLLHTLKCSSSSYGLSTLVVDNAYVKRYT